MTRAPKRKPRPGEISSYLLGHEVGFRRGIEKAVEAAELATRQACRGDFGLVGPAGIGMQIVAAIREWIPAATLTLTGKGKGKEGR